MEGERERGREGERGKESKIKRDIVCLDVFLLVCDGVFTIDMPLCCCVCVYLILSFFFHSRGNRPLLEKKRKPTIQ